MTRLGRNHSEQRASVTTLSWLQPDPQTQFPQTQAVRGECAQREVPSGGTREEQAASETLIFLNTHHLQRDPPQTPVQWPLMPVTQGAPFSTDVGGKAGWGVSCIAGGFFTN